MDALHEVFDQNGCFDGLNTHIDHDGFNLYSVAIRNDRDKGSTASMTTNDWKRASDTAREPSAPAGLDELRTRLDAIDNDLMKALASRIRCCLDIARHKRAHDIPMMQPGRIDVVQTRAAEFALENDIDPGFMKNLYELVIAETCRLEDEVIDNR